MDNLQAPQREQMGALMSSVNISGPYSLKVSHIGYSPEERSGINLSIGENLKVTIVLLL